MAATRRFGNLRDARALPVLLRALDEVDYRIRQAAADALGNIGDAEAAAAVATLLDDPHPRVRQSASGDLARAIDWAIDRIRSP